MPSIHHPRFRVVFFGLLASALCGVIAGGIPEPSLVLYGVVRNDIDDSRVTVGAIEWVFQPGDGSDAVVVSGELRNINDQFSYVLLVPCETPLPGQPASPDTLQLLSAPINYDRSQVSISGKPASIVAAGMMNLTLGPDDRGRIEQIDLTVSAPPGDVDGNGIADDWELAHFNRIGVDAGGDPDADGLTNFEEWKAGTDPNDFQSQFAIINISTHENLGLQIEWSSAAGRTYSVLRSTSLEGGFVPVGSGIGATPPANVFHDPTAGGAGPYFYLLQVDE
jgi:hypothetical protein